MHVAYQIKGNCKCYGAILVSNNFIYNVENMKIQLFKILKLRN